jgi:DNA-binding helix-hairpin-helix protein with protein kinase domain
MSHQFPEYVVDTNNVKYQLDRVLGSGGQGTVFSVVGKDLAIKLIEARPGTDPSRLHEEIARIRRLALDGLKIAKPLRLLAEPHYGYVMELMTGMVPLKTIAHIPRDADKSLTPWHIETGSLSRRLRLLAKAADLFKELHSRGMTYGDASVNNIFISESNKDFEAWLIDCDNICQGVHSRSIYTPGYAAPELFKAHLGADSLTDAWSLAVVIFETLCMLHPFQGDYVHDGPPEREDEAARGEIPWVDDEHDNINITSRGLPRGLVLTSQLQKLAADCFGLSRSDRLCRPSASMWSEKLHQAADQALSCPQCKGSYYLNVKNCPWCDFPRPSFVLANIYLRDPSLAEDISKTPLQLVCQKAKTPTVIGRTAVQAATWTYFTDRHLRDGLDHIKEVAAKLDGKDLIVRGSNTTTYVLENYRTKKKLKLTGQEQRLDVMPKNNYEWWLTQENAGTVHRVIHFTLNPGESQ